MALSDSIYRLLHDDATVEAWAGTRIFPGIVPFDTALPCIEINVGNILPDNNQTSDLNWDRADVSVKVISNFYGDSETYAKDIRTALSRQSAVVAGENIDTIIYESQNPEYIMQLTEAGTPTGTGTHDRTVYFTVIVKG